VTYQGLFPIIVASQDDAEIVARQTAEGGTGRYEYVDDDQAIDSSAWAMALADAKLSRYGTIQSELVATTRVTGFRAGQLATVIFPQLGVSGEYLVKSAKHRDEAGQRLVSTLTLVSGDVVGGWQAFYRKLAAANRSFVLRENEVLILARRFVDGLVCGDTLTASSASPESRIGYAMVGFAEIAA
jgi:hypothetical protein